MENQEANTYQSIILENVIEIDKIVTIFYFEYAKDFVFKGESHNFWEFLYVDKGQAVVTADSNRYMLEEGDTIFHKPNEFHTVCANGQIAPNLIVMSFYCNSPAMNFFENKILKINTNEEKNILAKIIEERLNVFDAHLTSHISQNALKKPTVFGSQQLIKIYLELFLIILIRNNTCVESKNYTSFVTKKKVTDDLLSKIIKYMEDNVCENLVIRDLCKEFAIGSTQLKGLFRKNLGISVMQYFRHLKMKKATELIREGKYNFTEISEILKFSSINYFSQSFKKIVGMTPSQYSDSVKGKIEW